MTAITRESHYVPYATLRRWSDDGSHVWAYRLLVSHRDVPDWRRHPIRGLTKQADLYTTFDGSAEDDDFEKFITREIEEPGQEAIEKVLARAKMTSRDWTHIGRFVVAQQMRTPLYFVEFVRRTNDQIPKILAETLKKIEERGVEAARKEPRHYTHLDEHLRVSISGPHKPGQTATVEAQVSSSRSVWLSTMKHFLTNRTDVINKLRWRAAEPYGDAEWPLTDHPVLTLNYYGPGVYDFGAGWGRVGSTFILPVSPRIAVYTEVGSRTTGRFTFSLDQTREVSQMMVERALRWVIARRPEPWVETVRPRVVDQNAFATEQATWRTWNAAHIGSEVEFRRE